MIELKGKYNTAKVYTDIVDNETISQITSLLNQESVAGQTIRIMPDTHAGAGCVIGTTMTLTDKVIPNLVEVDIGCGMKAVRLEETEIDYAALDSVIRRFVPSGFDIHERAIAHSNVKDTIAPVDVDKAEKSLGSLGGGNHFIEVARDSKGALWLVIHTGSRHLGIEICKHYQDLAYLRIKKQNNKEKIAKTIENLKAQGKEREIENAIKILSMQGAGIPKDLCYVEGADFENYIHDMRIAQEHAKINRQTIASVICEKAGLHIVEEFDTIHNYIDTEAKILRKGAISANVGEKVIIPMNMRDGSLICIGKGNPDWNFSAPHGAGRLLSRSKAKESVTLEEFKQSMEGIYTTSVGVDTLDESPFAYKPVESILENIQDTVDVVSIIKPEYNFKAGENTRHRENTKDAQSEPFEPELD